MQNFKVTVVKSESPVNKIFPKEEGRDNHLKSGIGKTVEFLPESFLHYLKNQESNNCIITGLHVSDDHYRIVSQDYAKKLSQRGLDSFTIYDGHDVVDIVPITYRGKGTTFSYSHDENGLLHIDCDYKDGIEYLEPEELIKALESYVPELKKCTKFIKHSSSNVTLKGESPERGNYHIYIVMPMRMIPTIGLYLHRKMLVAGHGCIYHTDEGNARVGGYIDPVVYSPERIIYTADPTLKDDSLIYHKNISMIEGDGVTSNDLIKYDPGSLLEAYQKEKARLKNCVKDRTSELKAQYLEKKIHDFISEGKSPEVARELAQNLTNHTLTYDNEVRFDDYGWLTIGEAIRRNLKGAKCADPIEYDHPKNGGPNKAMIKFDDFRGWHIHSMIHGGNEEGNERIFRIIDPFEADTAGKVDAPGQNLEANETKESGITIVPTTKKVRKQGICCCQKKFEESCSKKALQDFIYDEGNGQWTCNKNLFTMEMFHQAVLDAIVRTIGESSDSVKGYFNREKKEYAAFENHPINTKIVKLTLDNLVKELKASGHKVYPQHRKIYKINIQRLVKLLFVRATFSIDLRPSQMKKNALVKRGAKPSPDNMYFDYRTWCDKLPLIIDIMVRRGFIDCSVTGDVAHIGVRQKMYTALMIFNEIDRKVHIDDSPIYFEACPPSTTKQRLPFYVEQIVLKQSTLGIFMRVMEQYNRMVDKMDFGDFEPDARLVLSSDDGGKDYDEYRIIEVKENDAPREHFYSQKKKLEFVEIDKLHDLMACTHAICNKSLDLTRIALMKAKNGEEKIFRHGYRYHGIPMILSTNGIYTDKRGLEVINATKVEVDIGLFKFFPTKRKSQKERKWWE